MDADANGARISRRDTHQFQRTVAFQVVDGVERDPGRAQSLGKRLTERLQIHFDARLQTQLRELLHEAARRLDLPTEMDRRNQQRIDQQQRGEDAGEPVRGLPRLRRESGDHGDDGQPPKLRAVPGPPSVRADQQGRDDRPCEENRDFTRDAAAEQSQSQHTESE